ncbi:putrescine ABC transporter permease PotI, partial [Erwinia amylovora]|nr:putrescine ABC transporter permease PotI [Erwinia amylovora]
MTRLPVSRSKWRTAILAVCFFFLYAPMLLLVVYS